MNQIWRSMDYNGNGLVSLAEMDGCVTVPWISKDHAIFSCQLPGLQHKQMIICACLHHKTLQLSTCTFKPVYVYIISYVAHAQADTRSQQNTPFDPFWQSKYADQSPDGDLTKESFKELNNKPALMRLSWRFWPDSTRKLGLVQVAWELWGQFRMILTIHQLRRAYKATLRNPDGYVHKSLVCTRFHGGLLLPHCHPKLAKWMLASLTKPGEDWLQSASAEHVPSSDHVGL